MKSGSRPAARYRAGLYSNGLLHLLYDLGAAVHSNFDNQSVEMPMTTDIGISDTSAFNDAELAFLEGVFAYWGIQGHPTEDEFRRGLAIMSAYANQVQDNPPESESDAASILGIRRLSDADRLKMAAIVFVHFGATKPTSWQWNAAYERLFAPTSGPLH
jgi:hypothetical protein